MSYGLVAVLAWGPYLLALCYPKETHSARIVTNTKIKHDKNIELFAAIRWSLLGPRLLRRCGGSL